MKFFNYFFILNWFLPFFKGELLQFVENIDPDADCDSIKKNHPEMRIVCPDVAKNIEKTNEHFKIFGPNDKNGNSLNVFNESGSNNIDLESMLQKIEETTSKTLLDPQLNSLINKIDKNDFIDIKKKENEEKTQNKIEKIEKFKLKNEIYQSNNESLKLEGKNDNFPKFLEKGQNSNQIFKEAPNKIFQEDQNNDSLVQIKELMTKIEEIKDKINEINIKEGFESIYKEIKAKNTEETNNLVKITENLKEFMLNQKKQMEELNQNQKNLLSFLQKKDKLDKNQKKEENENKKQEIKAEKIDYKSKLLNLFELIKKEIK